MSFSFSRLMGLVQKERREMLRESSNILIGIVMPVMLLVIFGFGLSLDVKNVRICIVVPHANEKTAEAVAAFRLSETFIVTTCPTEAMAVDMLSKRQIDAAVVIPQHAMTLGRAGRLNVQLLLNATNASIVRAYESAVQQTLMRVKSVRAQLVPKSARLLQPADVRSRMWFNDANNSSWFLIPGVIVMIMAMIGCMLTAMQVAKEYEHGTMESLFATPVTPTEILVAKMVNNYFLGMVGLAISIVFSYYVFKVPMHGSILWIFLGSSLFLLSQMGMGLVISSATKSQFIAAQISMILSFLPVFYLSGFIYEIPNMPGWMQCVTYLLPARYFVEFLLTSFLAGDVLKIYVQNLLPLVGFTVLFLILSRRMNPKEAQR